MSSIQSFNLPAEVSSEIIAAVASASAFQAVSPKRYVSGNGQAIPVLGRAEAAWATRGSKKKVSTPSASSVTMGVNTLATIIPVHEDLLHDMTELENVLVTEGVSAIARTFDNTVAGYTTAPSSDFFAFTPANAVEVTDRTSFIEALGAAAASGRTPDSAVLSNSLKFKLMAATTTEGRPVFEITDTHINGIPYAAFDATGGAAIGFLGAFRSASQWGTVNDINVRISRDGSYTNGDGDLVSSFERNEVLLRIEGRYGFAVTDPTAFKAIKPEA